MKIFWSWQSDNPSKYSRYFIKECLEKAIEELSVEAEFSDREVILDHDTKDVPGSPAITSTIFEKIKNAEVFIADVTPVAETLGGKKVMNPNVAIEMGFAISELGNSKIVSIMNSVFGGREDLPFDLKYKRGPIFYKLGPNDVKANVKKELVKELKIAIRSYSNGVKDPSLTVKSPTVEPIFFDSQKPILRLEGDSYEVEMNDSYIYSTISPNKQIELNKKEIAELLHRDGQFQIPLIYSSPDNTPIVNQYGAIIPRFSNTDGDSYVTDFIQMFKDGKIISISNSFLHYSNNKVPLSILYRQLRKNITGSLKVISNASKIPCLVTIEIGLINKDECTVVKQDPKGNKRYFDSEVGPLEEEKYSSSMEIRSDDFTKIDSLLENFIMEIMNDLGSEYIFSNHEWN